MMKEHEKAESIKTITNLDEIEIQVEIKHPTLTIHINPNTTTTTKNFVDLYERTTMIL